MGRRPVRGARRCPRIAARPTVARDPQDHSPLAVQPRAASRATGAGRRDRPPSPPPLAPSPMGQRRTGPWPDLDRAHPPGPRTCRCGLAPMDHGPQPPCPHPRRRPGPASHRGRQPRRPVGQRARTRPVARHPAGVLVAARRRPTHRRSHSRAATAASAGGRADPQAPGQAPGRVRRPLPRRDTDHLLHPTRPPRWPPPPPDPDRTGDPIPQRTLEPGQRRASARAAGHQL